MGGVKKAIMPRRTSFHTHTHTHTHTHWPAGGAEQKHIYLPVSSNPKLLKRHKTAADDCNLTTFINRQLPPARNVVSHRPDTVV